VAVVKSKRAARGATAKAESAPDVVARRLRHYAERGVFRGFGPATGNGKSTYRILWHRGRSFELTLDAKRKSLRFACVLPAVPPDSDMYHAFKAFVRARRSDDIPAHRHIDPARAEMRTYNRTGDIALTLRVKDGDFDYGTQKLVHLVHEIYLDFLCDGRYRDYMVAHLGLDPDLD
jgi:hypothetical protein